MDPYRVLVSEIMLQQTRVSVVIPRYQEFLALFGTIEDLAQASKEEVRAAWSGLGYYRRAERLHESAQTIHANGSFPRTSKALRQLPGIGEYAAVAVASIAFGEASPVLDGNVARVVSRYLAVKGNTQRSAIRQKLLEGAKGLLDPERAGDSNQAMMELGATICRKSQPRCGRCPLEEECRARQLGRQGEYPTKTPRKVRKKRIWYQAVVLKNGEARKQGSQPPFAEKDARNLGVSENTELLLEKRGEEEIRLPGAWLLPEAQAPQGAAGNLNVQETSRFSHSIADTDYQVVLLREKNSCGLGREKGPLVRPAATRKWVPLGCFDENGRWRGPEPLPTSSMLGKAVKAIRKASQSEVAV